MINSFPFNTVAINGLGITQDVTPPVDIVAGHSSIWRPVVILGGEDVTHLLSGTISVDREEGSAAIARFDLFYPPGVFVPTDMPLGSVTIDYVAIADGETVQGRLFTGWVAEPSWSVTERLMSIICTDRRQQRVEAMELAEIDALIPGYWSGDVFEPVEGRSRRDYGDERLSTIPASLDCSVYGELRVTSWYATAPAFKFGPGTTIYESVSVDLAQLRNATNRYELTINYRYSRLWQLNENYGWSHPGEHGLGGNEGFCEWRTWSTETPDVSMVERAVADSGQVLIGNPQYERVILSAPNPCGDGNPWINTYPDLLLAAAFVGARRWVQTVTEGYKITLSTDVGLIDGAAVTSRETVSFEITDDRIDGWEDSLESVAIDNPDNPPGLPWGDIPNSGWEWGDGEGEGSHGYNDLSDESRRSAALRVMIRRAQVEIVSAHRETTVSWNVPTTLALGPDLTHTLELDDVVKARGKCRRIVHALDMNSGSAITTLSIAVMRGSGTSDPLVVPPRPDTTLPPIYETGGGAEGALNLPTQIGGRVNHPPNASGPVGGGPVAPYDPSILGFSGNYSTTDDFTAEVFPRDFRIPFREIKADYRDELVRSAETLIHVAVPNDLLEL